MPRGAPPTHWVAPDLGSVARAVRSAQERFLSGDLGVNGVRSLVLDSWRRSVSEGVDPQADAPPLVWAPEDLAAARDRSPLQGAMPMIRSLLTQPVEASGHVVAVGDAQGHLLWVEGDKKLRSRAEEMGFVAGTQWSEGAAGTNAPGTALTLNAPVQIFASEHFRGTVQPWSCTAVPIHDPHTGRVLGVLDVTGESQVATPQALAMVRATAMAVEQWLAVQQPAQAGAQLLVLGRRRGVLRRDGHELQLSTRHSELMVLLAATSEGLTGERLAVMLHEHDVPLVTVRAEMARLRTEGITDQELSDAKTYLAGALALSLDSSGSIANLLHSMQVDGLSPDHLTKRGALIAAVKLEDVQKMARRLLRDEALTTVVVGRPVGVTSEP